MPGPRARLVSDFAKDYLGPKDGPEEVLQLADEPRLQYQVGLLFPRDSEPEHIPEADGELLGSGSTDEEAGEEGLEAPAAVAAVNTRNLPSSLGMSFFYTGTLAAGDLRICVTWARYSQRGSEWIRTPRYGLFESKGDELPQKDASDEIEVAVRSHRLPDGCCRVSVFVTSALRCSERFVPNELLLFQPEIRVLLKDRTKLQEVREGGFFSDDHEWRISVRQYDKRGVLARGHLCGAYWDDVDPQKDERASAFGEQPFLWTDGQYFIHRGVKELEEFRHPHLRTDYLPMYSMPSPSFDWNEVFGACPELSTRRLSEFRSAAELKKSLDLLSAGYRAWITECAKTIDAKDEIGLQIIERHTRALSRIEEGVAFVTNEKDKSGWLAFLFMNRAMSLQGSWSKNPDLTWRPFQLAFILLCIRSSVEPNSDARQIVDILWFPTGGGKTEAYLAVAAFTMALRRFRATKDQDGHPGGSGTTVLSRYTLRLLTIQQFRRALRMVAACEMLRLKEHDRELTGWRPEGEEAGDWLWGTSRFSIGLWVGGNVTPNALSGPGFGDRPEGAIETLKKVRVSDAAEPAQVMNCPCCGAILSIPPSGMPTGEHCLHLFSLRNFREPVTSALLSSISADNIDVTGISCNPHAAGKVFHLELSLSLHKQATPRDIANWWLKVHETHQIPLVSFNSPVRPGYLPIYSANSNSRNPVDFEIRCPNRNCPTAELNFREKAPTGPGTWGWRPEHPLFSPAHDPCLSFGMPIPAVTVDEKLYRDPPSMIIATCDKIATVARLKDCGAASLFGRVGSYSERYGYEQTRSSNHRGSARVECFDHPDLIIQDELHLLDGPLGSAFGLYEGVVDELCAGPKYIASSATIRNANQQVAALMKRGAEIFPPVNLEIERGFFLNMQEAHPLDESKSGRLFIAAAAPGRAAQTPIKQIWGRLLQSAGDLRSQGFSDEQVDPFWTLVGYFNAIRELAGAETLWRQDIPQYIEDLIRRGLGRHRRRTDAVEGFKNLSSQTGSSELPGILSALERTLMHGDSLDGVATTSMFGTGVDVDRLSLMVVHGQPKSASSYIQAVGRIGRKRAGLAIVFLRVAKPRDLNHYEYFTGYHRRLPVAVEPISVKPMAPRALERTIGPLLVTFLRNGRLALPGPVYERLLERDGACEIFNVSDAIFEQIVECFRQKWQSQPSERRPSWDSLEDLLRGARDQWLALAGRCRDAGNRAVFYGADQAVLGEIGEWAGDIVFRNAPISLREVEATIKIQGA